MTRLRGALAVCGAAIVLWLLIPAAALADCAMPEPIERAVAASDVVFVGTVTSTADRDRLATIQVEEIWRGPDQPATLVLRGGAQGNSASSVDRTFQAGTRYLFVPYVDPKTGMVDNICTSTRPWTAELAALRPSDSRVPTSAPTSDRGIDLGGLLGPVVLALVVGGVLLGVGLLARGREAS